MVGDTSGMSRWPIRFNWSYTCKRLASNCIAYGRCCHLQPPHIPKYSQNGSSLDSEGLTILTMAASMYFFLSRNTFTSTTSPGTPYSMKTTIPSGVLAMALPSAATDSMVRFSIILSTRSFLDIFYKFSGFLGKT